MAGNGGRFDILKVMKALADAIRDVATRVQRQERRAGDHEERILDIERRLDALEQNREDA